MRLSHMLVPTTRETPAEAELVSHQLMLRAGLIRRLGSGLYTWMPMGLRVLQKITAIVREEMNRAGAQEVLMPSVHPAELWQASGRWDQMGAEMLRLKDRHKRDYCYGPTHEEVVTHHVKQDVRSWKQLPLNLYQIQTKFRDEIRPRFGLMRAREFVMKDAYSFHMDHDDLAREYGVMRLAYQRIFDRLGVDYRIVQADTGNIGGTASEEFHVVAGAGEDLLAVSDGSPYAANVEAAPCVASSARAEARQTAQDVATPGRATCAAVAELLALPLEQTLKLVVVEGSDGNLVALALRGDHELNEIKAERHPAVAAPLQLAEGTRIESVFGCAPGYLGVRNCPVPVIADHSAAALADFVCGANRHDFHTTGVNWGRDCPEPEVADLRNIAEGDPSPDGKGHIRFLRGIEVGHIFQLGEKYTRALELTVLDAEGASVTPQMGCYGIGVSRIAAAVVEQCHDDQGICWPQAVAPFALVICPIGLDRSEAVRAATEQLYADAQAAGVEVLLDDRGLRPGVMFADSELLGIPHRVVIGDKALADGQYEYRRRSDSEAQRVLSDHAALLDRIRAG
ncbi:proline--tRNA ligase [Algiphilus sp. NNCM1]|uniref:proline--tRNA ligase n=1 Tax=Algiphilus sp. TaxID=1872431 RepID=UPI001CA76BB4|nr:proline--tRNA ligase [Algiphilus sp.]MBY8966071.1 proline--tRNA ligase [Algiphilus acroporae]MCI5104869.1 proline--tRNA ligase [Algiphilus sp.]